MVQIKKIKFRTLPRLSVTNMNYQSALKELQDILIDLQEEAVNIDDLSQKVQRAAELIAFCQNKLRQTEAEISSILKKD